MFKKLMYLCFALLTLVAGIKFLSGAGGMLVSVVPTENLALCSAQRSRASTRTCIVDGDTLWLNGVNIQMKDFDTPEPRVNICGSFFEIDLAYAATNRLQELLNSNAWTIETFGIDGTGARRLATIKINGEDVGETLIRERLARRWPDGPEFWCE
ncbi:MAG: thermonuclease family protein [Marinosulfonomonas sp.]|nr:thermonuclease family protein [Marinosulfonomonas sp.]